VGVGGADIESRGPVKRKGWLIREQRVRVPFLLGNQHRVGVCVCGGGGGGG
jgi:hypothetical protein